MSFSPCLLIPIYNHGRSIRAVVARLSVYGLPIFIVDDGSDAPTQAILAQLAAQFERVRLFRLARNGGKGAAVMLGLREAWRAGLTHALQIDADGQHDTSDVPRFLELGAAHPEELICGEPVYDESVPKGRLYGRSITHFWVRVETLSRKVADSMCGFRLYPLAATCALIECVALRTRMDFDIEILVRLIWQGVGWRSVATRVIYPDDGLSHFDMLRDNLRISRTHARLTFGMLARLPRLIRRKTAGAETEEAHWSRLAERGSALGLRSVFACYRLLGARAAGALLYPVVAYFFLTGSRARAASLDYLRRVHRLTGRTPPTRRDCFRHMLAFGQSGLDKLAAWLGELDDRRIDFSGRDEFERLSASGRGAVLIGAHLGNLEMTRALAVSERRMTVNAVVYSEHAQRFNAMLRQANAGFDVNLIQVSHLGPETAILLKEKIERGELLVIVGDRTPPVAPHGGRVERVERVEWVEFLGEPAPFAQGPFILASLLDCPVYLFFCLREASGHRIHFERFAERIELPRGNRQAAVREYLRQYARRLEYYCLRAPQQWFNFYDFWQRPAAVAQRPD